MTSVDETPKSPEGRNFISDADALTNEDNHSESRNYSRFLNRIGAARQPSPLHSLTYLTTNPATISLAPGAPNTDLFPFKEAEFKLRDGTTLSIDEERMRVAVQYGVSKGNADLLEWLKTLQHELHNMPTDGSYDICVCPGSEDGLYGSFEMLISPGDNVLVESPTYAGVLSILKPMDCKLIPVPTDHHGIIPGALRQVLLQWSLSRQAGSHNPVPKVLYTVPNGVNPTGASVTLERRKEIYEIACQYDLLILEDDPYYFLHYIKPRIPSFLSMDVDGRVLRFDSFSKVISAGLRVGYVTGPTPLVERIMLHIMMSTLHTSSLSQVIVSDLLHRWGLDGFENHCDKVAEFYRQQKDSLVASANRWLRGLAEWNEPTAGYFLWMKLVGVNDTKALIEEKAHKKNVLFFPGSCFMIDSSLPSPYVRVSFSSVPPERMDEALQRLADLIKEEQTVNEADEK